LFSQIGDNNDNKKFPFIVGNIGFSIDSLEFVVGDVVKSQNLNYEIELKNLGEKPIKFRDGKSSSFIDLTYSPSVINPGETGLMNINFNVIKELPFGKLPVEVVVESDDKISPFKFLYLIANITEDQSKFEQKTVIDTVPRLIFDHYNFDFGHMRKGKKLFHAFLFTNMGSQDIEIKEIITSDAVKIIGWPKKNIASEENGSLVVKINFRSYFGVQHHTITLITNDPVNPEIVLSIHGSVYQKSDAKRNPDFCIE
jgi:hypothetical protein